MPKSFLERILQTKKEELAHFTLPDPLDCRPHRSFRLALTHPRHQMGLIAEVKQASPSKGLFRTHLDPAVMAQSYEAAGADAISVLTDKTYFHGSDENLVKARRACALPVLRKDFIIDERQIEAAARLGADAVLLIASALDPRQLHELYLAAYERGLEALVEVHDIYQADAVLSVFTPEIVGANNRDLTTFDVSLERTAEIGSIIPKSVTFISESGVKTAADLFFLKNHGAQAALIGETLIKAQSISGKVEALFGKKVNVRASRA
ncbi:MAG: indole-3-glycerol phosphate synthase TrpC [Sporolactobacillus sp.]|jgi:indole-3-glycerol phosphate synthase|nr:indole-3-glycerol phosphate synthase TrpC [Sporolactobacillus sp.]